MQGFRVKTDQNRIRLLELKKEKLAEVWRNFNIKSND